MNRRKSNLTRGTLAVLAGLLLCAPAQAQSLSGASIGGNIEAAAKEIGSKPIARETSGPFEMRKWKLADGNDLSLTAERKTGKIVYAETNWNGGVSGRTSDFPGFTYGKTTLGEIRNQFGSNGFAYQQRMFLDTPDGIVMFTSWEVEDSGVIATFVTKMSKKDSQAFKRSKNFDIDKAAKLDTIIIANADYLDSIWGEEKHKSPDLKPIRWELSRMAFEGIWAETEAECKDEEGPNSRTLIDLQNLAKGKKLPIFDQYENHCRIEDMIPAGIDIGLKVTCFEFWEKLEKNEDGQQGLVKLSARSAPLLEIDGKKYQLCKSL